MAKKTDKKISITTIDKLIEHNPLSPIVHKIKCEDETVEVIVDTKGDAANYGILINNIVNMCFGIEDNEYYPQLKTFAIQYNILNSFTNIKTDNIEKVYALIRHCPDLMDSIKFDISMSYPCLYQDIDAAIEYRLRVKFSHTGFDLITRKIVELLDKFGKSFEGFSKEDTAKLFELANAVASKDEKSLANAVLKYRDNEKIITEESK